MRDYSVTAAKKLALIALGLSTASLLARFLGPDLRGQYAFVASASAITVVLLNLGVSNAYQSERRNTGIGSLPNYVRFSCLFAAISLLLTGPIVALAPPLYAAVAVVSAISLLRMQLQSYALIENIRGSAVVTVVGSAVEVASLFVVFRLGDSSLLLALLTLGAKEVLLSVGSFVLLGRAYRGALPCSAGERASLIRDSMVGLAQRSRVSIRRSLPYFLITVLVVLNYRVDVVFLYGLGVEDRLIGIFAVGGAMAEYLWLFSDIFKDVQTSRTSRGGGSRDVAFANRAAIAATLVAYAGFLLIGPTAMVVLFGEGFSESFRIAALMLIANIFMIPCKIIGTFYISTARVRVYVWVMTLAVVLNAVTNLLMIPVIGIYGAVLSSIISYSVAGVIIVVDFRRTSGIPLRSVVLMSPSEARSVVSKAVVSLRGRTGR